jgi:hypothetical protein
MAKPSLEELFLGSFAYLIPLGVTVDGGVVSATSKPDGVPTANWTDYNIGSVMSFVPGVEEQDNSYMAPSAFGGWEKRPRKRVIADFIDLKTREMGELLLRLQFGLASEIALGTAQTIFGTSTRSIEAWLKFHVRKDTGLDLSIGDVLVRVELKKGFVADGKVSEPEFRCTAIKTYNGAAVTLNTIVFPAAA